MSGVEDTTELTKAEELLPAAVTVSETASVCGTADPKTARRATLTMIDVMIPLFKSATFTCNLYFGSHSHSALHRNYGP